MGWDHWCVRELPSGTVTFLFTDIEGSTRLLHELGSSYVDALAEHRRVIREAFARHGGVEVDTQGDAFFVAFGRAQDALAAAAEAQVALSEGQVRVRMGVHTGEPVVTDEGYVGLDVHRAARIAAVGYGGQVLVSQSTRDLVQSSDLRDLGEHRLKDLTAPEHLYQLGRADFPPLRSLNASNLPVAATPLVGRERELKDLVCLLREGPRVVTVTGPGGVGKTRLALQAAAELVGAFAGGVFFVPLASLLDADLVPATIASTLGVRELADLGDREALLVIDNVEHLLDAAPGLAELAAAAPTLKLLLTSRSPLRISGEQVYPLDPLPADDAIELFAARARAVVPTFVPDAASREICRRLDGLPLALQLAAARLRSLDTASLLERLDRRLPLLIGGLRDAPERQRTLRATIEWSYDLLDPSLQEAFKRLAVFPTFSLEGAETVADADFDVVDGLVEASLLVHSGSGRYLMLETIRELALELLVESGADAETRNRLLEFLTDIAARANLNIEANGPMRHDLVIPERDGIRAALEWAVEHEPASGLRLALNLENYWVSSVDPREGTRWIEALLNAEEPPIELRALALRALGNCAAISGNRIKARDLYERSAALYADLGDELRTAISLYRVATHTPDPQARRTLNDRALTLFRRAGFKKGEAQSLTLLAGLERQQGSLERAAKLIEQSIALCRETGFSWWQQSNLNFLATVQLELGRRAEAATSAAEALRIAESLDDRSSKVGNLVLVARIALTKNDALAGRLWGAIEAEMERSPVASWAAEHDDFARPLLARGGDAFDRGYAAGRELALPEAVAQGCAWADRLSRERS